MTRNTALIQLADDLTAVLADLLGLHLGTAVAWSTYARRDQASYLLARGDPADRAAAAVGAAASRPVSASRTPAPAGTTAISCECQRSTGGRVTGGRRIGSASGRT